MSETVPLHISMTGVGVETTASTWAFPTACSEFCFLALRQ